MAYRCKSCGYWFRSSDSDLCPECFTARDDISCLNYSDGGSAHSHGVFSDSDSGDDFLARQIREESRLSGDELLEELREYSDSARRRVGSVTPPNTYSRPSAPTVSYQPRTAASNLQTRRISYDMNYSANTPPKKKGAGCLGVIIVALFCLPFLLEFVPSLIDIFKDLYEESQQSQTVTLPDGAANVTTDSPLYDESFDGEAAGIISAYRFHKNYVDPVDAAIEFEVKELSGPSGVPESIWHCAVIDISLCQQDEKVVSMTLRGCDNNNNDYYTWIVDNDHYGTGSEVFGMPIIFNENVPNYEITVICENSIGEQSELIFNQTYDFIAENVGGGINDPAEISKFEHSYDYVMGAFPSSMEDTEGLGMTLKLNGTPREITPSDLGEKLVLEDEGLPQESSEWKMVKVMVVNKEKNYTPGSTDYLTCAVYAYDANGYDSFYCKGGSEPSFPMCSRVQNYELLIGFYDDAGDIKLARFQFTPNELYDSAEN